MSLSCNGVTKTDTLTVDTTKTWKRTWKGYACVPNPTPPPASSCTVPASPVGVISSSPNIVSSKTTTIIIPWWIAGFDTLKSFLAANCTITKNGATFYTFTSQNTTFNSDCTVSGSVTDTVTNQTVYGLTCNNA